MNWIPGNPVPKLLPLFALLALFLFRKNRTGSAALVFLPLICAFALHASLGKLLQMDAEPVEMFGQAVLGGAYALAALWLLSFSLARKHLFLVFLGSLGILFAFAGIWLGLSLTGQPELQMLVVSVVLTLMGLPVLTLALVVAGWRARRQYHPLRFTVWTMVMILAAWFIASATFFVTSAIAQGNVSHIAEFYLAMLVATGLSCAVLLPFLLLSFVNGFYRKRLKDWLHLEREELPPVLGVPPPIAEPATIAAD